MSCFGLFGEEEPAPLPISASQTAAGRAGPSRPAPAFHPAPPAPTSANSDTSICIICRVSKSKYCCPGCEKRTCSLTCCRRHKEQDMCSGRKQTVPFLRLPQFTDKDLVDDYFLLESVNEGVERVKRFRKAVCHTHAATSRDMPAWMQKLRYEARMRGTRIKFSPSGSSRATSNKTIFMYSTKVIHWTAEWVFASESGPDFKVTDQRIEENEMIGNVLKKKLHADQLDKRLEPFAASISELTVLLRHDASDRFHIVNTSASMNKCLAGKSVIDFPTFVVTHKDNAHIFPLLKNPVATKAGKAVTSSRSESQSSSSDSDTVEDGENSDSSSSEIPNNIPNKGGTGQVIAGVKHSAPVLVPCVAEVDREEGECSSDDEA